MNEQLEGLSLIDLISEQHSLLRRLAEDAWKEVSTIEFSHTDFFLLSKVERGSLSISQAAQQMRISRQAMQQCATKLEERGFITSIHRAGNKRDKYLMLTSAGRECCAINRQVKAQLEAHIASAIGTEVFDLVKATLSKPLINPESRKEE